MGALGVGWGEEREVRKGHTGLAAVLRVAWSMGR